MARPVVVDEAEGTRFPFLRGVLTRSLQDAGVPFETAYQLASEIRSDLDGVPEVTANDLRARVLSRLVKLGDDVVQRYQSPSARPRSRSASATATRFRSRAAAIARAWSRAA